jgi:hypothetical protein
LWFCISSHSTALLLKPFLLVFPHPQNCALFSLSN